AGGEGIAPPCNSASNARYEKARPNAPACDRQAPAISGKLARVPPWKAIATWKCRGPVARIAMRHRPVKGMHRQLRIERTPQRTRNTHRFDLCCFFAFA